MRSALLVAASVAPLLFAAATDAPPRNIATEAVSVAVAGTAAAGMAAVAAGMAVASACGPAIRATAPAGAGGVVAGMAQASIAGLTAGAGTIPIVAGAGAVTPIGALVPGSLQPRSSERLRATRLTPIPPTRHIRSMRWTPRRLAASAAPVRICTLYDPARWEQAAPAASRAAMRAASSSAPDRSTRAHSRCRLAKVAGRRAPSCCR